MKRFTSPTDGCQFDYYVENGNLYFKLDGLDWQDFCPEDRRAYQPYQYNELSTLLKNEKLYLSPHTAAFTDECMTRMGKETIQNIIDFFEEKLEKSKIVKL